MKVFSLYGASATSAHVLTSPLAFAFDLGHKVCTTWPNSRRSGFLRGKFAADGGRNTKYVSVSWWNL